MGPAVQETGPAVCSRIKLGGQVSWGPMEKDLECQELGIPPQVGGEPWRDLSRWVTPEICIWEKLRLSAVWLVTGAGRLSGIEGV